MDEIAVIGAIRGSASFGAKARIPTIAMTAHAMVGDREWFLAAGMEDYISKPLGLASLKEIIERVMAKRSAACRG